MSNIKEIQEFVRRKVIMACHSDCKTYEEALEKEINKAKWSQEEHKDILESAVFNYLFKLTLTNILIALTSKIMIHSNIFKGSLGFTGEFGVVYWDLTKKLFQDQTEETQIAIAKLLGWEVVDEI